MLIRRLTLLAIVLCAPVARAQVTLTSCLLEQRRNPGVPDSRDCRWLNIYKVETASVFLEEDFLQKIGPTTDRNYTMGLGFGRSGPPVMMQHHDLFLRAAERSVDWLSNHIARPLSGNHLGRDPISSLQLDRISINRAYSEMFAGTAFTPKDIRATDPVVGDRPYAFLLGWTVTRTTAPANSQTAWSSEVTVGTIGSRLGRNVQRFIHKVSRGLETHDVPGVGQVADSTPYDPKGWSNQIMDVPSIWIGVPTARYGLTWMHRLLAAGSQGWNGQAKDGPFIFDLTTDVSGEIGYYTDAAIDFRSRLGFFSIPFWAWRQDPLTSGSRALGGARRCFPVLLGCLDGFAFGGIRFRATGYNALLQGYPGYSGYHIGWGERKYGGTEISAGIAATLWWNRSESRGLQVVYELYANRSPEYETAFKRSHTWGGLYFTPIW